MTDEKKPTSEVRSANPFPQMEEDVLKFWDSANIFEKSVTKEAPRGDYVFYDGPPFITGMPHYATLLPSIAKDVIPRYWTMKGYRVERVWGWDCHGLPAENKVEKQLELKNKKDIEELGVGKFIDACRSYVETGSEQWQWYINRIGRWVDMKNAYRTMDLNFMESVIWAFKDLHEKGLIYEGYRTSLHCPRCATPLSKFEITMDAGSYKDVTDETLVVKFKLKNEADTFILAWTTTPWTLPGNLALAVGANIDYVKVSLDNTSDIFVLAKETCEKILKDKDYNIVSEFKGSDLLGLEYESLYNLDNAKINNSDTAYKIYEGDFVNTEDGTGIVHIAPNFGEDDFNIGKKNNLPIIDLMDENGIYTKEAGEWSGQYYKKVNKIILETLSEKIFAQFPHAHSYPFCYRCSTPLIYRTQKAWYLKIDDIRQKMIDNNKGVNWVPDYFKEGRFQYNLDNAPDWCLSRSRYWGSPIPVWKCQTCEKIKVVGSLEEIKNESGVEIKDLHKPGIDNIYFKCSCGGEMKRVPEVFDCWFESGSMPFAQFHYPFEKKDNWKNIFPADFIIEYTGQLRGWFYYLHVLSNALFDSLCFKNVIVTGVLAGTDGRKMSKSLGNYPDPRMTIEKYGSDAMRMYFMSSPIMTGGDMSLSEHDIQDALRKNIVVLWNVFKFFDLFSKENESLTNSNFENLDESNNILDIWITSKLHQLQNDVTKNLEIYNIPAACKPITQFVDELSTWYLRRSRDRFKSDDTADKKAAINTTGYVLFQLSKVMAPFMPFIAEQLWQKLTGNNFADNNKSIHLENWSESGKINNDVMNEMDTVRKIVELGLAKRDEVGVKVRQPLRELKVKNEKLKVRDEYLELLKDELNVKAVIFEGNETDLIVELDATITEELQLEGNKRDIVRFVNAARKNAGLTIQDKITIEWSSDSEEIKKTIDIFRDDILSDTLSSDIKQINYTINETEIKPNNINGNSFIFIISSI